MARVMKSKQTCVIVEGWMGEKDGLYDVES